MITRQLQDTITHVLYHGKAIIIMGARQVGKSTLLKQLFDNQPNVLWLNGDEPDVRSVFEQATSSRLKAIIGKHKIVILDEAQRIRDIGIKLKLITDNIPDVQLVATGSSSFELSNRINEPLTGRKFEYQLFPLSFGEMVESSDLLTEKRLIPHRMVYGYYPDVVTSVGMEREILAELTNSYLYKDILSLDSIQKSDHLLRLLQCLALQLGSQVSYSELALQVGIDAKTVERYISLLEKCYIVFRLMSFSRNLRNELKKSRKIYFYDNGIRNAVIGNYTSLENRMPADIGALWENFVIAERIKKATYDRNHCSRWFWRTKTQHEVDYIEEADGIISAYEFKWNPKKAVQQPKTFVAAYPESRFYCITPDNIEDLLL